MDAIRDAYSDRTVLSATRATRTQMARAVLGAAMEYAHAMPEIVFDIWAQIGVRNGHQMLARRKSDAVLGCTFSTVFSCFLLDAVARMRGLLLCTPSRTQAQTTHLFLLVHGSTERGVMSHDSVSAHCCHVCFSVPSSRLESSIHGYMKPRRHGGRIGCCIV